MMHKEFTDEQKEELMAHGYNWWLVFYDADSYEIRHSDEMRYIWDGGYSLADCGIQRIEQCWNGDDLS